VSNHEFYRGRRNRASEALRAQVRETRLSAENFIQPVFVVESPEAAGPIPSMPGVSRFTVDQLPGEIERILGAGIRSILLFGVPARKDDQASAAFDESGIVPRAIQRIRETTDRLTIMTDVCLCSYTKHGHCGIAVGEQIDNDATLPILGKKAVAHARAGADVVAPSGMMDGMVAAIRAALGEAGLTHTAILSYAVKYASCFYGPFRDAADSTPQFGDRRSYQMDPANVREAVTEARADVSEGADMIMVKPAGPYLDVISTVKREVPDRPLYAYQVSGEYGMIKAAAANGWLDEPRAVLESLLSIKRAGADAIITYFAVDAIRLLRS